MVRIRSCGQPWLLPVEIKCWVQSRPEGGPVKDFDPERAEYAARLTKEDREFKVGGEEFLLATTVRPEVLIDWDELDFELATGLVTLHVTENVLKACLADDKQRARWTKLRERTKDPLTLKDLITITNWAVGVVVSAPPTEPEPSSDGLVKTGHFSTVGPPSTEETSLDAMPDS